MEPQGASFEQPRAIGLNGDVEFILPMNKTVCEIVAELQGSWVYSVLIAFKFVACTLGAVLTVYTAWRKGVKWLVHANSTTLFTYYYVLVELIGLSYAILYGFEFIRLRFYCFHFDFRYLLWVRTIGLAAIIASHYVIVLISLERLLFSLYPKFFEKHSTHRLLALVGGFSLILITFFLIFYAVSAQFKLFYKLCQVATIDLKIPENSENYQLTFNVLTYTLGVTFVIFVVDCYLNFGRKFAKLKNKELSVAYQFNENRKVLKVLIPLELMNSVLTIFATLAQLTWMLINPETSFIGRALFVEASALSPFYPLIFAGIMHFCLRKSNKIGDLQGANHQPQKEYFEELRRQWDSRPPS